MALRVMRACGGLMCEWGVKLLDTPITDACLRPCIKTCNIIKRGRMKDEGEDKKRIT